MILLEIARKSLANRRTTTILAVISIALSVALLLGIERIRSGSRKSFENTVSGIDLIVGARGGPINLLLYSVFRIGNATNNISYESFEEFSNHESVAWTIPISLGDSHRGYRVVGTNENYFKHYKYAGERNLEFKSGKAFSQIFEVVLGSEVARKLNYKISDQITLSHGAGEINFQEHSNKPFKIVGVLKRTGTLVDKSLHVSLKSIEALHVDWNEGAPPRPGTSLTPDQISEEDLNPADVTAFFIKLESKLAIFNIQREINDYPEEPLTAILPGVSLRDLWKTIGAAEKSLFAVGLLVFLVSVISMVISLLATLNERRREMAILRSVGASKKFIFTVLISEACLLGMLGIVLGIALLYGSLIAFRPLLESQVGLTIGLMIPSLNELIYLLLVFICSIGAGLFPSWLAYKNSLADGLTVRN